MLGRAALLIAVTLLSRPLERVVAVVDDEVVCLSEVRMRTRPRLRQLTSRKGREATDAEIAELHKQLLGQIIDERIIEQQARTLHIEVSDEEIDRGLESVAESSRVTVEAVLEEVARVGMSTRDYRDEIRHQVRGAKWVLVAVRPKVTLQSKDEKEMLAAIEDARGKELARLKKRHYIEIRL